jgi:type IV secretion system protein VirB4
MQKETPPKRRTISYFRHLVQDYDQAVASILDNFSNEMRLWQDDASQNKQSGIINKLFDANSEPFNHTNSHFNVFEMGSLMELGDRIVIPALRYLIHKISKEFDKNEPTLLIFDESFLFFKHPLLRSRIIEWVKTVRKFNVAVIFATQELEDLFNHSELRSALKTNCATKIFLPNRQALSEDIYTQYKAMDLNDKQISLIAHALKGEYFYFSELGNRRFTLDLATNQASYALLAKTSNADIKDARAIKANYSDDEFAYHWLEKQKVDPDVLVMWRRFYQQLNNKD